MSKYCIIEASADINVFLFQWAKIRSKLDIFTPHYEEEDKLYDSKGKYFYSNRLYYLNSESKSIFDSIFDIMIISSLFNENWCNLDYIPPEYKDTEIYNLFCSLEYHSNKKYTDRLFKRQKYNIFEIEDNQINDIKSLIIFLMKCKNIYNNLNYENITELQLAELIVKQRLTSNLFDFKLYFMYRTNMKDISISMNNKFSKFGFSKTLQPIYCIA